MKEPARSNTALNAAIITFGLGCIVMVASLWLMIVYVPLFIASFVLCIVAASQGKTGAGVTLLLANIFAPLIILAVGFASGMEEFDKAMQASTLTSGETSSISYKDNLELYGFEAKYIQDILRGKTPGVRFKLKNNGDSTLSRVAVTVYFKNASGQKIYEKELTVVNSQSIFEDNPPLKPGYIWDPGEDQYITLENVPSEWQEGNADYEITDIDFN